MQRTGQGVALLHLFKRDVTVVVTQRNLSLASGDPFADGVAVEVNNTHHDLFLLFNSILKTADSMLRRRLLPIKAAKSI